MSVFLYSLWKHWSTQFSNSRSAFISKDSSVVRFAVVYIQDKIVPPTAPSVHIRTEAPKIAWLPAYLHSLTEFKHSAYNFRLQDILTLVYLFFTLDLDETGFKYFVAYN